MAIEKLNITRIRNVKLPTRANKGDAGIDIYLPMDLTRVDMEKTFQITKFYTQCNYDMSNGYLKNICLQPGENVLIKTGLKINVPEGYVLKVENKSSVASEKKLMVGACVIDSSYTGEVIIDLHNVGKTENPRCVSTLCAGDKIAQLVLYKIETPEINEVETVGELFKDKMTSRGNGGFGSTGSN